MLQNINLTAALKDIVKTATVARLCARDTCQQRRAVRALTATAVPAAFIRPALTAAATSNATPTLVVIGVILPAGLIPRTVGACHGRH